MLYEVEKVWKIFQHPYPQNRSIGDASATGDNIKYPDGIREGKVYYWENRFGSKVLNEPIGILSLTNKNDATTSLQ